jgi:hypothetical protein
VFHSWHLTTFSRKFTYALSRDFFHFPPYLPMKSRIFQIWILKLPLSPAKMLPNAKAKPWTMTMASVAAPSLPRQGSVTITTKTITPMQSLGGSLCHVVFVVVGSVAIGRILGGSITISSTCRRRPPTHWGWGLNYHYFRGSHRIQISPMGIMAVSYNPVWSVGVMFLGWSMWKRGEVDEPTKQDATTNNTTTNNNNNHGDTWIPSKHPMVQ